MGIPMEEQGKERGERVCARIRVYVCDIVRNGGSYYECNSWMMGCCVKGKWDISWIYVQRSASKLGTLEPSVHSSWPVSSVRGEEAHYHLDAPQCYHFGTMMAIHSLLQGIWNWKGLQNQGYLATTLGEGGEEKEVFICVEASRFS